MMQRRTYTVVLICLLSIGGGLACKKTVKVNLNNVSPRIVIEGEIINQPGPYEVRVTKTVNFSDDNIFPPVSGAEVRITDTTNGIGYDLAETSPGLYTVNGSIGIPRHTYQLYVKAEGQVYTALSTMPDVVHLDSVTFAINTDFNGKKDLNAVVNFQDPVGVVNYYQFLEYVNGRLIPNNFVFEDRLSDGRYIEQPLYNDSSYLQKGDSLLLRMYCIDKNVYNYFFSLLQVSGNNGGFQSASPDNPVTNLSGGALGYFSAHTVSRVRMEIY